MKIGLTAHDAKKMLMENFCIAYQGILSKHELFSTGDTGRMIEGATALKIEKHLPGNLGGIQQLGAQIEYNELDVVIALRDPHNKVIDANMDMIGRLCDTFNIPIATNLATAELLVLALDRGDLNWREMYR